MSRCYKVYAVFGCVKLVVIFGFARKHRICTCKIGISYNITAAAAANGNAANEGSVSKNRDTVGV